MTPPTVCILAAGRGSRLGDATADRPKNLIPVAGVPVLDRQLAALDACGVDPGTIRVITGYAAEVIGAGYGERVGLIHNDKWDVYNNIYTVLMLAQHVPDDLLLMNGDTMFATPILASLLACEGDATLVIDDTCPLAEEQMKVTYRDGRMTRIGKDLDPGGADGEYIGLLRFRGEALAVFYGELERMVAAGRTHEWYEGALNGIADRVAIASCSTGGSPWIEIDTLEDLAAAEALAPRLED